jgi:hypothetical protein
MTDRMRTIGNDELGATSFAGVRMAQYWCDLYLWEVVFNSHPDAVLVVELGSFSGGLSAYLESQCRYRGMEFRCYDVIEPELPIEGFEQKDIFRFKDEIIGLMADAGGPVILFCDNGNKPRELRDFTQQLPEGSVVLVHDWGTEAMPSDVPEWLYEVYGDLCDEIGSITRCFQSPGPMAREEGLAAAQPLVEDDPQPSPAQAGTGHPPANPCSICGEAALWHDLHGQWGCETHHPEHEEWQTYYERAEIWMEMSEGRTRWFGRVLRGDGSIAARMDAPREDSLTDLIWRDSRPDLPIFHITDDRQDSRNSKRYGPPVRLWDR